MILFVKRQQDSFYCFVYTNILVLLIVVTRSKCSTDVRFFKSTICDVDKRVSTGCSAKRENHGRGIISCSVKCARDEDCMGASLDEKGNCFTHKACPHLTGCDIKDTNHHYVTKTNKCGNGGVWNFATSTCLCVGTWLGPTCENYPTKCSDLITGDSSPKTVRTKLDIHNDGSHLVPVSITVFPSWCQINALINAGERDFNRTWTEYREGFYIDDSHFWIGLDHMYALHQARLFGNMLTQVISTTGNSESFTVFKNGGITLSALSRGYSLTYTSYSLRQTNANGFSLEDCWSGLRYKPFSTWDKDEDEDNYQNCASNAGSGWWYGKCNPPCNLLGWSLAHSDSKPPSSIMKLAGVDMEVEKDDFDFIRVGILPA